MTPGIWWDNVVCSVLGTFYIMIKYMRCDTIIMSDKVGKIWNEAVDDWHHSRRFTGWTWLNSCQAQNEHMWLLFNSAIRSPCYLHSLIRLPALPHYLQKFLQSTCTHMLPTLDINLLPTPVTGYTNWVSLQVTVGGNGQWHAERKKILGRWARKNLHLFSCLGLLISLLDIHCTTYTGVLVSP